MLRQTALITKVVQSKTLNNLPSRCFSGIYKAPPPVNEPISSFLKGTPERISLEAELKKQKSEVLDIPLIIHGKEVRTGNIGEVRCPHNHQKILARYHKAGPKEIEAAISSSIEAKQSWANLPYEERISVFLRLAELISQNHRSVLLASTVLGQSKNFFQAEIDAACEFIDFLRFNASYATNIFEEQPQSPPHSRIWNRQQWRPIEGFVYAVTPFNFTAIAGNLCSAPALLGNTVIWKPSDSAILSNYYIQKLFHEAGLPAGVINFIPGEPNIITEKLLGSQHFGGLHFTGSSAVFRNLWNKIGQNVNNYRSYPRIVGETGGKDFIFAHNSADVDALATALICGAFEYAGQKCSAASRAYVPASLWPALKETILNKMKDVKLGDPEHPSTVVNAVINRPSFDKLNSVLQKVRNDSTVEIVCGGSADDSVGYFVEPTILRVSDGNHFTMNEEFFGPVLAIYVYNDNNLDQAVQLCDQSSPYSLTGSIFARDRLAISELSQKLKDTAGNFYVNDKCTGAVVGQQPFGGSRASGTNDKAGSPLNLYRWLSSRIIKETFTSPTTVLKSYQTEK